MTVAIVALLSLILGVAIALLVATSWVIFCLNNLTELLCNVFASGSDPAEHPSGPGPSPGHYL